MAGSLILRITTALVVLLAALAYQIQLPRMVSMAFGLGRPVKIQPLSAFPYTCRRLRHDRLRACEDMWLSEKTRQLFLACSSPEARLVWAPSMGIFNHTGRSLNDAIVVIDVDDLAKSGTGVNARVLPTPGFYGTHGDGRLHLVGMTGEYDDDDHERSGAGSVRLWLVNDRPSVNPATGEFLDNSKIGANSTIELFRTNIGRGTTELQHVKTFSHPQIASPNRIAAVGGESDAFYFVNSHGTEKIGLKHHLAPLLSKGDVSYCDHDATSCREVVSGLTFPNGLARGRDGRIYVPSSLLGYIDVFEESQKAGGDLVRVNRIDAGFSLDNLSPDRDGDIYAAAIPDAVKFLAANNDPYHKDTPATALKITRKNRNIEDGGEGASAGYEVTKVVEDGLAEVLPGATTVVHDATTGRLFLSGVFAPYIAVCEPNAAVMEDQK